MRQQPELGLGVVERFGESHQVRSRLGQKQGQDAHAQPECHQLCHGQDAVDAVGRHGFGVVAFAPDHRGVVGQGVVRCDPCRVAGLHVGEPLGAALFGRVQRDPDGAHALAHQVLRWPLRRPHRDVGIAPGQAGQFVARLQLVVQLRVRGFQTLERRGHQGVQHRVGGGDAHPARHQLGPQLGRRAGRFDRGLHLLGVFDQRLGEFRGQVAGACALEDALGQAAFEPLQRAEDRGRVHPEPLAGVGQRAGTGQREHGLQVGGAQAVLRWCMHGLSVSHC